MTPSLNELVADPALRLTEALESWSPTQEKGFSPTKSEEVIRRCLELPHLLARISRDAFVSAPVSADPAAVRRNIRLLFIAARLSVHTALAMAEAVVEEGVQVAGAEKLPGVLKLLEEQQDGVLRYWTLFSEEDVAEARAAHARGECLEMADALAEVAGVTREEWLAKVEERQQGRGR
jgi:hypothetical protein